jgi:hypothetical protein
LPRTPKPTPASYTSRAKAGAPQCVAIKRNGERCKAAPIHGAKVCRAHGGATQHVKRAARERLLELVDPALAELHRVLTDATADDAVKVRAALGILDRTGHGPGAKVELGLSTWDQKLEEVFGRVEHVELDRSGLDELAALGPGMANPPMDLSAVQLAQDAQADADAERGPWDAPPSRIFPEGHVVVRGEVVDPPQYERDDG